MSYAVSALKLLCIDINMNEVPLVIGILGFSYQDWLHSKIYLCDQHTRKALGPRTPTGLTG